MTSQLRDPANEDQARADLAFLRNVVSGERPFGRSMGIVYGAAGLLYGTQCAVSLAHLWRPGGLSPWVNLANAVLPTVLFVLVLVTAGRADRHGGGVKGPVGRAIDAAFSGTGLAILVLIVVFGVSAYRQDSMTMWLYHPVVVCVLQGAVWYGAAVLRRRCWMGGVAAGWLLSGLAAGLLVENLEAYLLVLTVALFAFMAVPGYVLLRLSRTG
ncbi:hypothetical protein [Parvularcula dongshanensis]|uniref:Uncharacterized protein n=1 Tax=Parvularcula dongshanensis TaxID=1173995 RepID=A0A840I2Q0_9PROT|nr:hypothetical protein [Parvularcula dongshanensis]MBB4659119.1 hypothetical protein [Parvularcula dongshanensis]